MIRLFVLGLALGVIAVGNSAYTQKADIKKLESRAFDGTTFYHRGNGQYTTTPPGDEELCESDILPCEIFYPNGTTVTSFDYDNKPAGENQESNETGVWQ